MRLHRFSHSHDLSDAANAQHLYGRRPYASLLSFFVVIPSLPRNLLERNKYQRQSKAFPFCQAGSPIAVPPRAGPTATATGRGHLSVSQSGAFPDCVTRFRGGALRHAKFPKTSYKVQLLDTLKHGRCVNPDHSRGRGLIFLSKKVLVLFWQNASVLLVCPSSPQSGASPQGEADKVPFSIFLTFIRNDTARQQERRGFIFLPKHMCISIYKKTAVWRFFVFYFP